MPEYEFFNANGEYRCVFFNANDPALPSIGQIIEHEGEQLRRVASKPGVAIGFQPFVGVSRPINDPDAPHLDREGRPSFQTEREVREYMSRKNDGPGNQNLRFDL